MATDPNAFTYYLNPQSLGVGYQTVQGWPYRTVYNPIDPRTAGWGGVQPMTWPGQQGMPGTAPMDAAGTSAGVPPQPDPNLDVQALSGFLQDVTSTSIRKLYDYLSQYSERYPQLANGITLLTQAVELFKARDYARAFAQLYEVHRYLAAIRASTPDLPAIT